MKKQILLLSSFLSITLLFITFSLNAQNAPLGVNDVGTEDFETGDFSQYEWQFGGNADWTISEIDPYEGSYCAKSGLIFNSQSSSLSLDYLVYSEDVLSFWYKVSSESNYDYLRFYVDGVEMDKWSGTVPWTEATYTIVPGQHTFEWEYSKDGSVSVGDDAAWIDMITFPPAQLEAIFTSDTTYYCQSDIVYFYDQSVGPVTEWHWIFNGATPSQSNFQNPVVAYPNPGSYGVYLQVSDGTDSTETYIANYITIGQVPAAANQPNGISFLCASWGNTTYNTAPMGGDITGYQWNISPAEAGTISGGGTNITMVWDPAFLGEAELTVSGINYCGLGPSSDPLVITRYLPDVNVILPAYVAIGEPAFTLTGGTPSGGTYSGDVVSGGMFDPAAAGLGEHIITYSYTDINLCTNTATDVITVTEFIGMEENSSNAGVRISPNPSSGIFLLKLNPDYPTSYDLAVYNSLNKRVFAVNNMQVEGSFSKVLDLGNQATGIYYLHITGKNINVIKKLIVR